VQNLKPAIFIDRDGVINENRADYVKTWQEFEFLPDVFEPFTRLAKSEFLIIIISNQSPIGRGLVEQAVIDDIFVRMKAEIHSKGGRIDAIFYCPHAPEEKCNCRKPKPGLFLRAAEKLGIDLSRSFFIGDAISDMEAALNVGCQPVFVLTGRGSEQLAVVIQRGYENKVHVVENLASAVNEIVRDEDSIHD